VDARYLLPPAEDPGYLDELNALVEAEGIEVVHPQPEQEVLLLSRETSRARARPLLPRPETVELCQDKERFAARVAEAGLPTPQFARAVSEEALREANAAILERRELPLVSAVRGAGARARLPVSTPA